MPYYFGDLQRDPNSENYPDRSCGLFLQVEDDGHAGEEL